MIFRNFLTRIKSDHAWFWWSELVCRKFRLEIIEKQKTKWIFQLIVFRMDSQRPQIARWFNTADKDRSGRLSADQLQAALRNNDYSTFDPAVCELGLKT